jgi:hypothetical protein
LTDDLLDAFERRFGCFGQPTQRRKLGAQADVLFIFGRPGHPVGEVLDVHGEVPNFSIA